MWYLKFKYKHSDCIYVPKLQELNLNCNFYFLSNYEKNNYTYTTAMITIHGKNIKKFINYLKKHKKIVKVEDYGNTIIVLAKHKKDLSLYKTGYNPKFIHPSPAYLSKDGYEIIEAAFWEKQPLLDFIKAHKENKTTTYFELIKFVEKKMDDIYVTRLLPKLAKKQEEAIKLAYKHGYYSFPRKISLDELAKIAKVSKPTFRENLRKAEVKLTPNLISE